MDAIISNDYPSHLKPYSHYKVKHMKISALAKATATNTQTLRYYERVGLLTLPMRCANGYRSYAPQAIQQVTFIRHCRELDMSLSDIEQVMLLAEQPDADCNQLNILLQTHLDQVRVKRHALDVLETQLLALQGRCGKSRKACDCGILKHLVST
ncbi:MAG: MerR family transcriptional regulator [Pseudomonadota bacterium]